MQKPINTTQNLCAQHSPLLEGCPQGGVLKKQNIIFINNVAIKYQPVLELPYNTKLKGRAKALRQAENLPEVVFWMQVTKKRFHKMDFDRQRIIDNYIVDFYIKSIGLIIEIDGANHDDKEHHDKFREEFFVSLGLKVYRITVDDVMRNMNFVMMGLEDYMIKAYGIETH